MQGVIKEQQKLVKIVYVKFQMIYVIQNFLHNDAKILDALGFLLIILDAQKMIKIIKFHINRMMFMIKDTIYIICEKTP